MLISQNTAERHQEIVELFESVKPLLDDGVSIKQALIQVGRLPPTTSYKRRIGWGRDLLEYAITQGYDI